MVTTLDIKVGHLYWVPDDETDEPVIAEFAKELRDGRFAFKREGTDRETYIEADAFEKMLCDGRAKRVRVDPRGIPIEQIEIDPVSFLDPEEPGISRDERDERLKKNAILKKKQTLRFYALRYDDELRPTKGRHGLAKIIKKHLPDALAEGYDWQPSPSSLLRAIEDCGSPGDRPLVAFFKADATESRERRWPKEIVEAAARAIEAYWDDGAFSIGDAIAQFVTEAKSVAREHDVPMLEDEPDAGQEDDGDLFALRRLDEDAPRDRRAKKTGFPIPCEETIRLWIHKNADWWHWAQRYGVDNANRRFRGRGRAIDATRPLEYVMFDHTQIDVWSVVMDDEGQPLFVARAWLTFAIDVYSRMILGAVIGYEPPTIHSVITCLKQVVRRKDFLAHYGEWKGAADGWGKPFTIIVDNGKEFVSPSFQASCEATGIDVIWAPVKTPTFKPFVERAFGTFNSILWHKLPGGLPLTPQQRQQLGMEAEAEAVFTRTQLEKALWNAIVTIYHLETHSGIEMSPAMKWTRGLSIHKRAVVDDIEMVEKIVGRGKTGLLSATGVTIEGHRFHDPELTTMLMNRLGHLGKLSRQRNGVTSSRTVRVRCTWDPGDVTQIHVFDPQTRTSVTLPNWDRKFSKGLSWFAAKKIRQWAQERALKFHSDEERAAARVAHRQFLLEIMPSAGGKARKESSRILEPLKQLTDGDRVEMVKRDEQTSNDVTHDTGAKRAEHKMEIKKGRVFGGKAGAAKAAETRRENRRKAAGSTAGAPPKVQQAPPPDNDDAPRANRDAIKAKVAARLAARKKDEGEAA